MMFIKHAIESADFLFEEGEKNDRLIVRDVLFKLWEVQILRQNMSIGIPLDRLDKRKIRAAPHWLQS